MGHAYPQHGDTLSAMFGLFAYAQVQLQSLDIRGWSEGHPAASDMMCLPLIRRKEFDRDGYKLKCNGSYDHEGLAQLDSGADSMSGILRGSETSDNFMW